jgi:hypothetical protein
MPTVPVVRQHLMTKNRIMVLCPLCTDGYRIARDPSSWVNHLVGSHDCDAATFFIPPSTQALFHVAGTTDDEVPELKFSNKCYGCSANFSSLALLVAHISDVHSIVWPES